MPSKSSVICSDHIKECDIRRQGKRVKLIEGALPTRFKGRSRHPHLSDANDDDLPFTFDDDMNWVARDSKEMEDDSEIETGEGVSDSSLDEDINSGEEINQMDESSFKGNSYIFIYEIYLI